MREQIITAVACVLFVGACVIGPIMAGNDPGRPITPFGQVTR